MTTKTTVQAFLGQTEAVALHVPGHTPADMTYQMDGGMFVGDTLFMPDVGTARADFPGGDAYHLHRSIQRISPSIQVNMRAGQLPPADDNGITYLRIPLNTLAVHG